MRRYVAEILERAGCWLISRAYEIEPDLLDASRIEDEPMVPASALDDAYSVEDANR